MNSVKESRWDAVKRKIQIGFQELTSRFHLTSAWDGPYSVTFISPRCTIRIGFERDGCTISSLDIQDPKDKSEYIFLYIMLLRCPGYPKVGGYMRDEHISDLENLIPNCKNIESLLITYCEDLLDGDFCLLNEQGYEQFSKYIQKSLPLMINMPRSDPIAVKFWKCDWSWLDDLRKKDGLC